MATLTQSRRIRDVDELDELVLREGRDAAVLAAQLCDLAHELPVGAPMRAEILVAASEQSRLAADHERSVVLAREAVSDGGPVRLGARAHVAAALYAAGEIAAARDELAHVRAERSTDPTRHLFVGQHAEMAGDVETALRWYTRGLVISQGSGEIGDAMLLLMARHRVRDEMGLPPDEWDLINARITQRAQLLLDEDASTPARRGTCPCGSGRRAKRCCGRGSGAAASRNGLTATTTTDEQGTTFLDLVNL